MFSRTSRILLLAAVLLLGAYFLIERPREQRADHAAAQGDRLAGFELASIDSIAIEQPRQAFQFARADSVWRMTAPLFDLAEPGAIGRLLDALNTADINRTLGPEQDLSPYGLDHPDAVITLASMHHVVLQVAVGKNTVDDAWCYARAASGAVLLVPTDVHRSSTLPIDAYRDHRVANFQLKDIDSFTVISGSHGMSWARHGRGWINTESLTDTVVGDSVGVEAVLRRLRGLRVASFPGADDHERIEEVGSFTLTGPSQNKMSMPIASLSFERIADGAWRVSNSLSGRVVLINDDVSDLFAHTVTELRDRRLLQFDPAVAVHITFESPSASGELVRAGGRWAFPNPASGRVDPERAADFVRGLRALKWYGPSRLRPGTWVGSASDVHDYRFEIVIHDANDRILDKLKASSLAGLGMYYVTSQSSTGPWVIEYASLAKLASLFTRIKQP